MSGSASSNGPARTPEGLHALLEHAFNHADLDVDTDAHEDDATLVVPRRAAPSTGVTTSGPRSRRCSRGSPT